MEAISKISKNPGPVLFPVPTVLVTAQLEENRPNIITIAWTGIMSSNPPTVYIGVQPARYSHRLIAESGEYVINIPSVDYARAVDYCGIVSGKDVDKFKETGFTPVPAQHVKAPLLKECPVNVECKVKQVVSLGSHDVFIAEAVATHFDEEVLDENGRPDMDKLKLYAFCLGQYRAVSGQIGSFGYAKKK